MSLASNALISVDTYITYARVPHPGQNSEARLQNELVINAASDYVETYCDRTFLSGSAETEIFDGQGYAENIPMFHTEHVLKQAPVSAAPTLKLYLWDGDSWDAVDTSSYTHDATDGVVYFPGTPSSGYRQPGYASNVSPGYFAAGTGNYRIIYSYGYDTITNIPADLAMATSIIAKYMNMSIDHAFVESSSSGDRAKTFTDHMPLIARVTLDKYKR